MYKETLLNFQLFIKFILAIFPNTTFEWKDITHKALVPSNIHHLLTLSYSKCDTSLSMCPLCYMGIKKGHRQTFP